MELKFNDVSRLSVAPILVLIVPLWNWNQPEFDALGFEASSNRTFMELK